MTKQRQILLRVLTLLLVLSALLLPMTALAQGNGVRWNSERTIEVTVDIPWDANRVYPVNAGRVQVMFFPGSLPPLGAGEVYSFKLRVTETSNRGFIADLVLNQPGTEFQRPVPVKFGTAREVFFCDQEDGEFQIGQGYRIPTRGGWVMLEHFSRYSGWY